MLVSQQFASASLPLWVANGSTFAGANGSASVSVTVPPNTSAPGVVAVVVMDVSSLSIASFTCGGATMTESGGASNSGVYMYFFTAIGVPTGSAQTVSMSLGGSTAHISLMAVAYSNTHSFSDVSGGSSLANRGSGTIPSMSVFGATGKTVLQAFTNGGLGGGYAISGYTGGTERIYIPPQFGNNYPVICGDVPGLSTQGFSCTDAASTNWIAAGLVLGN